MKSTEERNKFIINNYNSLRKICTHNARLIKKRYPTVPFEDIEAYGFAGIIEALDRIDTSNDGWILYISKYAYHYAAQGAKLMLGIQRLRFKGYNSSMKQGFVFMDPNDIISYINTKAYEERCNSIGWYSDDLYERFENNLIYLIHILEPSLERIIICGLFCHLSLNSIAHRYGINIRKVRKIIQHLKHIFETLERDLPVSDLLTPLKSNARTVLHYTLEEFKKNNKTNPIAPTSVIICKNFTHKKAYLKLRKKQPMNEDQLLRIIRRIGVIPVQFHWPRNH